jgi:hypothetical protein
MIVGAGARRQVNIRCPAAHQPSNYPPAMTIWIMKHHGHSYQNNCCKMISINYFMEISSTGSVP